MDSLFVHAVVAGFRSADLLKDTMSVDSLVAERSSIAAHVGRAISAIRRSG